MERLERILHMIDRSLNTRKKRHIAGGILVSVSLLFGGLAVTVISLKREDIKHAEEDYETVYLE